MSSMILYSDLINYDFNTICAICNNLLDGKESCSIQKIVNELEAPDKQLKAYDILNILADFERIKIDNLPEKICMDCFQSVVHVYKFHDKCQKSLENMLHYWLIKFETEKVNFKEEYTSEDSETESYKCVNVNEATEQSILMNNTLMNSSVVTQIKQEPESIEDGSIIIELINCEADDVSKTEFENDEYSSNEIKSSDEKSDDDDDMPRNNSKAKFPMNLKTKGHWAKYQKVPCEICNQYYRRKYMPVHMRMHTNERPFHCRICFQTFKQQGALKTHLVTHEPDREVPGAKNPSRPFVCEICGNRFKTRSVLVKHEKIHLKVLPYACTICDKKFCRQDSLKQHIDIVHNKIKYKCPVCSKPYSKTQYLKKHQKVANHYEDDSITSD